MTAAGTDTKKTSSEPIDREKSAKFSTHESEDDDSKNSHKRNLDFSGDKESEDPSSESVISSSSSQCITWSSDCTVRYVRSS